MYFYADLSMVVVAHGCGLENWGSITLDLS